MKYSFPTSYRQCCYLVPIDAALLPLISGALAKFQTSYVWATDADYEAGYNAFAEVQAQMSGKCVADLIESNNRLYRLLDAALNGTVYTATAPAIAGDPYIVTPAIPPAPSATIGALLGLRARLERLINLVDNLATGAISASPPTLLSTAALTDPISLRQSIRDVAGLLDAGWFGVGGHAATLADVVRALRIGAPAQRDKITTALQQLQAGSSVATIFGTVENLFSDIVNVGGEGAVVATLIASSMAQAAISGLQAGQIDALVLRMDRVIASLDGGGNAPPDNVLLALRGTQQATTARNVIDKAGADQSALFDDVENLLVDIRTAVQ